MKVQSTDEAKRQTRIIARWWRKNREKNPGLFIKELADVRSLLRNNENAGKPYGLLGGTEIRRLLLEKTRHHVYYYVDEEAQAVRIIAVVGAVKGSEPDLSIE